MTKSFGAEEGVKNDKNVKFHGFPDPPLRGVEDYISHKKPI